MIAFTVLGIPAHPLIVHGAVVGVPLAALGSIAYVALPAKRLLMWWPLVVTVALAWIFSILAGSTGEELEHALRETSFIEEHAEWAERLGLAMHVLSGTTIVMLLIDRYGERVAFAGPKRVLRTVAAPLACVAAIACLGMVGIVGHLGAQAAWHDSPASTQAMQDKTAP